MRLTPGDVLQVRVPAALSAGADATEPHVERLEADDTAGLFADSRASTALADTYRSAIAAALDGHAASGRGRIAACLMEPIMQGAGGMNFVDPLFQKLLAAECRGRGVPVIADEVFAGLWRLGHPSACGALGIEPDVACYAKLLTAGMVPLSATLASEAVFKAFEGDTKAEALLHGHSYTAHPTGCQVQTLRCLALAVNAWCACMHVSSYQRVGSAGSAAVHMQQCVDCSVGRAWLHQ